MRSSQLTHASVPAFGIGIIPDNAGIALLQVLLARRLDNHWALRAETALPANAVGAVGIGGLGRARSGWSVHGVCVMLYEP